MSADTLKTPMCVLDDRSVCLERPSRWSAAVSNGASDTVSVQFFCDA
jgi:hypothetical protein